LPHRVKPRPGTEEAASSLARSVVFRLIRLVNLAARPFVERIGRPYRLTLPEWRVLVVLAARPGSTGAEIAFGSGLDKMAVSRAVASLERAGRAIRARDAADRRMERISLSAKGDALYRKLARLARRREDTLLDRLGQAERRSLGLAVDTMIDALIAADRLNGPERRKPTARRGS
jgi:DNA-binding MarR family transcriptional regulator